MRSQNIQTIFYSSNFTPPQHSSTFRLLGFCAFVVIVFFGSMNGCSQPPPCVGKKMSDTTIDPKGSRCKESCECSNQVYLGFCNKAGTCESLLRGSCQVKGEIRFCVPVDKSCEQGRQVCGPPELKQQNWGDCICGSPSEAVSEAGSETTKLPQEHPKKERHNPEPSWEPSQEKPVNHDTRNENKNGEAVTEVGMDAGPPEPSGPPEAYNHPEIPFSSIACLKTNTGASRYFACDIFFYKGTFKMGSPTNEPGRPKGFEERLHAVVMSRPFTIWNVEVTQLLFEALMKYNPSRLRKCPSCPVDSVNWHEAISFCNKLSLLKGLKPCVICKPIPCKGDADCKALCAKDDKSCPPIAKCHPQKKLCQSYGRDELRCEPPKDKKDYLMCKGYRLPTEAEWEYAARAKTTTTTYFGPIKADILDQCTPEIGLISQYATYCGNSKGKPIPVGQRQPNKFNAFDMIGNVYEWVWDAGEYPSVRTTDPIGKDLGKYGYLRGGDYLSKPRDLRVAARKRVHLRRRIFPTGTPPKVQFQNPGFRCARTHFP